MPHLSARGTSPLLNNARPERTLSVCRPLTNESVELLDEENTRHCWLRNIPRYCSGDRCRVRTLAHLPMACWSTAAGTSLVSARRRTVDCRRACPPFGFLRTLRARRSRYACADLPNAPFSRQWIISVCAKSYVCRGRDSNFRSRVVFQQCSRS